MAPAGRATRKRAIEDSNSDPCKFLKRYFQARGIPESPEDDAELLGNCAARAEKARESFKRWRGNGDEREEAAARAADDQPDRQLTAKEKYQRRLVNNRKSAAAARVYQEVLRREHTHALRIVSRERDILSDDVARLKDTLRKLKEENARLAARDRSNTSTETDADLCTAMSPDCGLVDGVQHAATTEPASGDVVVSEPQFGDSIASKTVGKPDFSDRDIFGKQDDLTATVASATILPVPQDVNASDAVASVGRAILPIVGSQSQGQGTSQEDAPLCRGAGASGAPLYAVGVLNSQLSQGDGSLLPLRAPLATPSSVPIDEFPDAPDLFGGSQGLGLSQVLASQPGASQPGASQSSPSQTAQ